MASNLCKRTLAVLRALLRDRSGNVAVMFGLAIVPLMLAIGMAVDLANLTRIHGKLSAVSDAVALAVSKHSDEEGEMDEEAMTALANRYLEANGVNDLGDGVSITAVDLSFDTDTGFVSVEVTASVDTTMMGLAGINHMTTSARTVTAPAVSQSRPASVALVLDVSGSMGWNDKIGTLRTAATDLLDKLHEPDPDNEYVRTGLVTYSTGIRQTATMDWGIEETRAVVQTLSAGGGTASTAAVAAAGGWLRGNSEEAHHNDQPVHDGRHVVPQRFLIFMTDGDNNNSSDDTVTKNHCDSIKGAGIEIFTVAFEAPWRGRQLLRYCADDEDHYFDATNPEEFLSAFDAIGERIQQSMLRIVE